MLIEIHRWSINIALTLDKDIDVDIDVDIDIDRDLDRDIDRDIDIHNLYAPKYNGDRSSYHMFYSTCIM